MQKSILLSIFIGLQSICFAQAEKVANDIYWNNPKYTTMSLDSVEKAIREDKKTQIEKDSLKVVNKNRDRKNAVRFEFLGRSPVFGIVYDRKIIQKKLDLYVSVHFSKSALGAADFVTFGASTYLTSQRWRINPLFGITVLDAFFIPDNIHRTLNLFLLGAKTSFYNRVEIQLYYAPGTPIFSANAYTLDMFWINGGLNIGYKF